MESIAASQLKGLQCNPELRSQKQAASWIGYAKLPLGVWCPETDWCLTQGVFLPHAQ